MYKAKNQLKLLRIAYAAPACSRQDLRPRKEEVGFIQNRACGGGVYSEWYTREEEEEEEEEEFTLLGGGFYQNCTLARRDS